MSRYKDKLDHLVVRDKFYRSGLWKHDWHRAFLKGIWRDERNPDSVRWEARAMLKIHHKKTRITRAMNRCTRTGRARAVDRRLKSSRIVSRDRILYGNLPGITKTSW